MYINEALATKQGVTQEERYNIQQLYASLGAITTLTQYLPIRLKQKYGKMLPNIVEAIEFELQKYWHFELDANCHTWWNKTLIGCTCPIMDNLERFGQPKIINTSCIFHGGKYEPKIS